jgi:hypothetical protein
LLHAAIGLALKIALFVVELAFVDIVQVISDGAAGYDDNILVAEVESTAENMVSVIHNQVNESTAISCACCLLATHFSNRVHNHNPGAGTWTGYCTQCCQRQSSIVNLSLLRNFADTLHPCQAAIVWDVGGNAPNGWFVCCTQKLTYVEVGNRADGVIRNVKESENRTKTTVLKAAGVLADVRVCARLDDSARARDRALIRHTAVVVGLVTCERNG